MEDNSPVRTWRYNSMVRLFIKNITILPPKYVAKGARLVIRQFAPSGFSIISPVLFWMQKNHNIAIYVCFQNLLYLFFVSLQYLIYIFISRQQYFKPLSFYTSPFFMCIDSSIFVLSNNREFLLAEQGFLNYFSVGRWAWIFPMIVWD